MSFPGCALSARTVSPGFLAARAGRLAVRPDAELDRDHHDDLPGRPQRNDHGRDDQADRHRDRQRPGRLPPAPDVTLRGGLFESRGGVGVDKGLFGNRLRLSLDVYDFNREPKAPHLRFEGRYLLGKGLFAYAGWDDPTFSDRSSMLFGAGYSFIDEDIKYYAGAAAIAAP